MTVSPDDIAGGTLPPDASVWDRRMKALTMRNAGATFPRIAEQLGVSEMTVRNDIRKAVQEVVRMPVEAPNFHVGVRGRIMLAFAGLMVAALAALYVYGQISPGI